MQFIWNVSEHVGDHTSCANRPTDVDLVKILIGEAITARRPTWLHQSLRMHFLVNGTMDVQTAYWIRVFNADHDPRLPQTRDGIISPARGSSYASQSDTWTIFKLNWAVRQANATLWANLPNHPQAKPALRAELQ
jgi:hypothetical protein